MRMKVGAQAPDFELKTHDGEMFKLSDYRGKRVLLSFHPLAWTSVCQKQMQRLEKHYLDFVQHETVAVGISVDPVPSKEAWAKRLAINNIALLSDFWPHGEVAMKYDIFDEETGASERANILIDEEGEITVFKKYPISEAPEFQMFVDLLDKMDAEKGATPGP